MAPVEVHHLKQVNLVPNRKEANSHVWLPKSFILEEIITTSMLPLMQIGKSNTKQATQGLAKHVMYIRIMFDAATTVCLVPLFLATMMAHKDFSSF